MEVHVSYVSGCTHDMYVWMWCLRLFIFFFLHAPAATAIFFLHNVKSTEFSSLLFGSKTHSLRNHHGQVFFQVMVMSSSLLPPFSSLSSSSFEGMTKNLNMPRVIGWGYPPRRTHEWSKCAIKDDRKNENQEWCWGYHYVCFKIISWACRYSSHLLNIIMFCIKSLRSICVPNNIHQLSWYINMISSRPHFVITIPLSKSRKLHARG